MITEYLNMYLNLFSQGYRSKYFGSYNSQINLDGIGGSNPLLMRSGEDFGEGETRFN